jgi:hypothetical protein
METNAGRRYIRMTVERGSIGPNPPLYERGGGQEDRSVRAFFDLR